MPAAAIDSPEFPPLPTTDEEDEDDEQDVSEPAAKRIKPTSDGPQIEQHDRDEWDMKIHAWIAHIDLSI